MLKTYVLDTNVLLQSPDALEAFEDNELIIPGPVLEELDSFKRGADELNAHAREVIRRLHALRAQGPLTDRVPLACGGSLRVVFPKEPCRVYRDHQRDNDILAVCTEVVASKRAVGDDSPTVLVTNDILLGVKADALGVPAETFRATEAPEEYTGHLDAYLSAEDFAVFGGGASVDVERLFVPVHGDGEYRHDPVGALFSNQFVTLHNAADGRSTLLGRVTADRTQVEHLHHENAFPFGVTPRNAVQRFIIDALMDSVDTVPLVIIKGPAGTAKTFLSLAVGMERVYERSGDDRFRRILACRPNVMLDGDEHGFLPGTEQEKIAPLMRPLFDNLECLLDSHREANDEELADRVREIMDRRIIETQAVGYLRGRSIERTWIIVDEAQNLGPKTAKALISRAGMGSKLIICGDPQQIDSPYLSARANALTTAAENMRWSRLCAVITTEKSSVVRSPLAKEAVRCFGEDFEGTDAVEVVDGER